MAKVFRSNHAMQVRTASGINTALGLYLIASAWVWGFNINGSATWNCVAVGIVIALFGAARVRDPHYASTLSWINLILGAWIIVSPWVYGYTLNGSGMWNSIILGRSSSFWRSGAAPRRRRSIPRRPFTPEPAGHVAPPLLAGTLGSPGCN